MALIREATEDDNDALNGLQRKCPMGTRLVLGVDSSPDYFARSRPFRDWHVFAAVDDNAIVGSAAFAVKDTYVGGRLVKAAYEYGFMVDYDYRRKGIAKKLQGHIEQVALDAGVDLLHLDIIEDNVPSTRLFSGMGFTKVRDCTTFSLMPFKKQKIAQEENIRCMEENDAAAVTNLINETYSGYDFFAPYQPGGFLESLERMPRFDLRNILLLEYNGELKACLGYWKYDKVRKYIVQRLNWKLKTQTRLIRLIGMFTEMPRVPRLGEALLSYNVTVIAYRNLESLTELVRNVLNTALNNKINFVHATVDPKNPVAAILSRFMHTKMKLCFFMKSLRRETLPNLGERRLYIDAREM